jgi:hypothetical protein
VDRQVHEKNRSVKRPTQWEQQYLVTTLADIKSDVERELQNAWDEYARH